MANAIAQFSVNWSVRKGINLTPRRPLWLPWLELIVDDDHKIGEVLQKVILQQTDYQVVWMAESEAVLKAAPSLRPSLILLDYMLPAIHGLELYDRLQEGENMRGVPVILISAWETVPFEALRERDIYLLKKPFELTDLLDMLAQLLSN